MTDLKNIKLHYFTIENNNTIGRGEYVRLLLEDAGVEYEYVRHTFAEWKDHKQKLLDEKIRDPTLPYVTIDGKYYSKTAPLLRFFSNKLNKYEGSNADEIQLLDAYADMIMDWSTKWAGTVFGSFTEAFSKTYKEEIGPTYYKSFNDILSDTKGPFLLGETITYPDFALYHIMEDDSNVTFDAKAYPHLDAFVDAIRNRPNLKTFFATDRA
ncbi:hypothetical protein INT47_010101 [Mucor saturninus]|uniref:Glutathione S-transferase n=1 Tax=Mucor saturninus TaxID=64648 RepID=A0A8H7R367_9FUNG|nr:hypothetical protein INT47_010101 [Mucor saturninus]